MLLKRDILLLAIIVPLTAEILNGSTRILELTSWNIFLGTLFPYVLLVIILAYLVQEAISFVNILFLLPIAGIIIEGLITKSFFNVWFSDLSVLSGVGVWGGVQWVWTISLIASHAFVSFLIPIALTSFFVQKIHISKFVAYLSSGILAIYIIWISIIMPVRYEWYWIKLGILIFIILLLIRFSKVIHIKNSQSKSVSFFGFFFIGLLFPIMNWLTSFFLATKPIAIILTAQMIFISVYLYFLWSQWFNKHTTKYKRIAFITWYYIPYAVGLTLVGIKQIAFDYGFTGIFLTIGIIVLLITAHYRNKTTIIE